MSKEALKLALEALEYIYEGANNQGPHTGISLALCIKKAAPVITALRQALANEALDKMAENARDIGLDYEHPTQYWRAYASDYERGVIDGMQKQMQSSVDRAVNAMAEQPAQQEPVAWKLVPREPTHEMLKAMDECSTEGYDERLYAGHASSVYMAAVDAAPTPPAQRTWVGLTDEEKSDIWCVVTNRDFVTEDTHVYADAIEAKLKEKNNG